MSSIYVIKVRDRFSHHEFNVGCFTRWDLCNDQIIIPKKTMVYAVTVLDEEDICVIEEELSTYETDTLMPSWSLLSSQESYSNFMYRYGGKKDNSACVVPDCRIFDLELNSFIPYTVNEASHRPQPITCPLDYLIVKKSGFENKPFKMNISDLSACTNVPQDSLNWEWAWSGITLSNGRLIHGFIELTHFKDIYNGNTPNVVTTITMCKDAMKLLEQTDWNKTVSLSKYVVDKRDDALKALRSLVYNTKLEAVGCLLYTDNQLKFYSYVFSDSIVSSVTSVVVGYYASSCDTYMRSGYMDDDDDDDDDVIVVSKSASKTKRGRPKKHDRIYEVMSDDEIIEEPPKKKRGRPKKTETYAVFEQPETKVGRPPHSNCIQINKNTLNVTTKHPIEFPLKLKINSFEFVLQKTDAVERELIYDVDSDRLIYAPKTTS